MILVDTSLWIDYLRSGGGGPLGPVLDSAEVITHPFVVGELACGTLKPRAAVLYLLHRLPLAPVATDTEVLALIEVWSLMGRGVGYIDVHLLASAAIGRHVLWTRDGRLAGAASSAEVHFEQFP